MLVNSGPKLTAPDQLPLAPAPASTPAAHEEPRSADASRRNSDSASKPGSPPEDSTTTVPASRTGSQSGPSQPQHAWSGLKVNQTAFIHKLYSMLEDQSISYLISWTSTSDSFVITPGEEFSKVLSQYFKHTNVSSFVRQLNMYGFHKVNDTFHGGSTASGSDSIQWEFRHGLGAFKRGDVESLRAIKRRSSRQSTGALRDGVPVKSISLSVPSTPPPQQPSQTPLEMAPSGVVCLPSMGALHHATPATGASPRSGVHSPASLPYTHAAPPADPEQRLQALEQTIAYLQDSHWRLANRNAVLSDLLKRCHGQVTQLVDLIASTYPASKSWTAKSAGGDKPLSSPRTKSEEEAPADLDRLRQSLLTTSTIMAQLDEQPYVAQGPPQSHPGQAGPSGLAPAPPQDYAAVPPQARNFPQHLHPAMSYANFKLDSNRERAQSVIYDPLAPAPTSEASAAAAAPGPPLGPAGIPSAGYFAYDPQAIPGNPPASIPTYLPSLAPSRDQRPGSFPLVAASPYSRLNSAGSVGSAVATSVASINGQYSGLPSSTPAAAKPPQLQPQLRGPSGLSSTFRRHTSSEVYTSLAPNGAPTNYHAPPLSALTQSSNRQDSHSSISSTSTTGSNGIIHKGSISSGATSPSMQKSSPPLKPTSMPRQNSSSVQSLLNPSRDDDGDERDAKRLRQT